MLFEHGHLCGRRSRSVSITVTAEDDVTEIAVFEGVLMTATVEPELAIQTVTWSSIRYVYRTNHANG